jgi:flagellar motor switch protein FliN/FliY
VSESLLVALDQATAELAQAAATAVVGVLPVAEPLEPGAPTRDGRPATADGQAVVASFSGSRSGEVVVVVGAGVVAALENTPLGALDLTQALRPALEAAIGTLGPVVLDGARTAEPNEAVDALLAKPRSVVVPLLSAGQVHATVGLAVSTPPPAPAAAAAPVLGGLAGMAGLPGLDLLRGVEMDVTAELGRTRMTLNDLLSLADGAVIELDRAAGAPADLLVNGRLIARGEVVVIDENFGLRITEIVAEPQTH